MCCLGVMEVQLSINLREDEKRIFVVLFVVVLGVVFVSVVSLSPACCLVVCGGRGRGWCWLCESAVYEIAFSSIPFRVVSRCANPGHVAREVVVASVGSVWL